MPRDISALARFLELLIQTEPDAIELSGQIAELLSPLPDYPGYILRIEQVEDAARHPRMARFVCRNAVETDVKITSEILLNDMREAYTIARYRDCERIRVQGLSDIITEDYLKTFAHLRESFRGEIEFCPTNRYGFATALAAEWAMSGGGNAVVTSFGGVGGFAPTEEIIMILKLARLRKVGKTYAFFPEMANLLYKITDKPIRRNKPILGKRIFHVESGIHVDGILKNPKCYEPFSPETVGLERRIIIGKQSGASAIKAKLDELAIKYKAEAVPLILERVKTKSEEKNGALTDREFAKIARGCVT
jgi:homocitrate synthase NifV